MGWYNSKMNKTIIFAGGCFWCTEHDLRALPGVVNAMPGYAGDAGFVPSYENHEGFRESVLVTYDPTKTTVKKMMQFFLDHIDPTDAGGQFHDRGVSYTTAIFYDNDEEKDIAEDLIQELGGSGLYDKPIAVQVLPRGQFYTAEEYHQQYAEKNAAHYEAYRKGSGREDFVNNVCAIRDEKHIVWKD